MTCLLAWADVDGCTLDTDGCNGDAQATCSLGNGMNSRTCTCGYIGAQSGIGYFGTDAALADDASFGGCTGFVYMSGPTYLYDTVVCPAGASRITTSAQCEAVRSSVDGSSAGSLGYSEQNSALWPPGCYYDSDDGQWYLNTHQSGAANAAGSLWCTGN